MTSQSLIAEFGELRSIADGRGVDFFDHVSNLEYQVDGLFVSSAVVIVTESSQTPTVADVRRQALCKALLERILANLSKYTTEPPGCLEAMGGITAVAPVISGCNFRPEVESACKAAGVRYVKINCSDYSPAI